MRPDDDDRRREIDLELQSHFDARVAHLRAQGLSDADARAEALRRFGDMESGRAALTLACVGIYGIANHSASERMHEMGVRVALGATSRDLVGLVVRSGLRLAALGGAIGLLGAALGGHLLASLLFDVSPFEPGIYVVAWLGTTTAALAAMLPPAVRAARVDAVVALRDE